MNRPGWGPILALAGLAVFSFAFTLVAKHGLWPQLPPGALHDTDLWAGLAGGVVGEDDQARGEAVSGRDRLQQRNGDKLQLLRA